MVTRTVEQKEENASAVRGVAVLDRQGTPLVLHMLEHGDAGLHIEQILYASLDRLDEVMMDGREEKESPGGGYQSGLYLGLLASEGLYSVYGFVTSVNKRVLLCIRQDQAKEKIGDGTVCDVMGNIAEAYVDYVANPFVGGASAEALFSSRVTTIIATHLGEDNGCV